ncbi:MAG: acyltransferase family protein [Prevotella sp.]
MEKDEKYGKATSFLPHKGLRGVSLASISAYRTELMGIAMIFIVLFHVPLSRWDPFFGLRRMGNIGVDMFLFLSGVGLWFSWAKHPDWKRFMRRRYLRVYPAWLIVACLYYIPRFRGGSIMAWIDLIGDITINWDFWLHDELTFWYVPAIMMLYLFAPAYMRLITKHRLYRWLPVLMVMWCVAVQWVGPIHDAVGHIEIFWSRMPIFFIGINMGESVRKAQTIDGAGMGLVVLLFVIGLGTCIYLEQVKHGKIPLFIERMLYIPLTITAILIINKLLGHLSESTKWVLRFVGLISLEFYLIHVHFVLNLLPKSWSYWPTFLVCFAATTPLAWGLNKIAGGLSAQLSKRLPE